MMIAAPHLRRTLRRSRRHRLVCAAAGIGWSRPAVPLTRGGCACTQSARSLTAPKNTASFKHGWQRHTTKPSLLSAMLQSDVEISVVTSTVQLKSSATMIVYEWSFAVRLVDVLYSCQQYDTVPWSLHVLQLFVLVPFSRGIWSTFPYLPRCWLLSSQTSVFRLRHLSTKY